MTIDEIAEDILKKYDNQLARECIIADYICDVNKKLYDEIYNRGYADCFNEHNDYMIKTISKNIVDSIRNYLFDDGDNVAMCVRQRIENTLDKSLKRGSE